MSNETSTFDKMIKYGAIAAAIMLAYNIFTYESKPKSDSYALHLREQHNKIWIHETRVAQEDDDDGMCAGMSFVRAGNVDLVGSCGPRLNLIQSGGFSYGF